MVTKKHIEWIDIAKGIGVLLVIVGHTFFLGIVAPLYTFHLPLFFLLSGLVFNEEKYRSKLLLLKTKAKSLLRPWLVLLLISFCICLLIPEWRENLSWKEMLKELYTTNTNNIQNSSLWYFVCLYMMFVLYALVGGRIRSARTKVWFLIVFSVSILFIKKPIAWFSVNIIPLYGERLPFKIDTAMIALVFFLIGLWYKDTIMKLVERRWSDIVLLMMAVCVYVLGRINGWTNLNSYDFGYIPFLFYFIALSGILVVLWISHKIDTSICHELKNVLLFYGRNSLVIFGFQSLFIRLYLYIFNHLQGLDMQLYQNNEWYHQVGAFLVTAFVGCPLAVWVIGGLRKKGIRIL